MFFLERARNGQEYLPALKTAVLATALFQTQLSSIYMVMQSSRCSSLLAWYEHQATLMAEMRTLVSFATKLSKVRNETQTNQHHCSPLRRKYVGTPPTPADGTQ